MVLHTVALWNALSFSIWLGMAGVLLLVVGLTSSEARRLPVATSVVYFGLGMALGPSGLGLIHLDLGRGDAWFERATELAVLMSLFAGGLKLRLPLRHKVWRPALRMAGPVMVTSIVGVACVAAWVLNMPFGHALLLGAVLAPTDPVLASAVSVSGASDEDPMRYGLSGEAGLNDGLAFPFVALSLGWLEHHGWGPWTLGWALHRLVWAVPVALALGFVTGQGIGRLSIALRSRLRDASAPSDLLALSLIALAYAAAELAGAWGFLSVFAAGLGLRHAELRVVHDTPHPVTHVPSQRASYVHPPAEDLVPGKVEEDAMAQPAVAAGVLLGSAMTFATTMERLVEVAFVGLIGVTCLEHWDPRALWIALALFVVIRPISTRYWLLGTDTSPGQRWLMGWFGIRGVGSLYYLAFALAHGLGAANGAELTDLVISTVALSIVVHGLTVHSLLGWYARRGSHGSVPRTSWWRAPASQS